MKAFIISFLLLAFIYSFVGASQEAKDCLDAAGIKCRVHSNVTKLREAEEIEPFCKYFTCWKAETVACKSYPEVVETLDRITKHLDEFCDSTSRLHKAVVETIACVAPAVEDDVCFDAQVNKERVDKASEELKKVGISEISSKENGAAICIKSLYFHTCEYQKVKKCGENALYALVENYKNLWFPYDVCNSELINNLPKVIEALSGSVDAVLEESKTDK